MIPTPMDKEYDNYSSCLVLYWWASFLFGVSLFTACLPVDTDQPECFPEEGCPKNFLCVEGSCVEANTSELKVNLQCLGQLGCEESLIELGFEQACLILEQPNALHSLAFNFNQARTDGTTLNLPIQESPLRASVVLVKAIETEMASELTINGCPETVEAIEKSKFHRECSPEEGCLLRLRTKTINVNELSDRQTLELDFNDGAGHCLESVWGGEQPVEQCAAKDLDCDGFVDEGLRCE